MKFLSRVLNQHVASTRLLHDAQDVPHPSLLRAIAFISDAFLDMVPPSLTDTIPLEKFIWQLQRVRATQQLANRAQERQQVDEQAGKRTASGWDDRHHVNMQPTIPSAYVEKASLRLDGTAAAVRRELSLRNYIGALLSNEQQSGHVDNKVVSVFKPKKPQPKFRAFMPPGMQQRGRKPRTLGQKARSKGTQRAHKSGTSLLSANAATQQHPTTANNRYTPNHASTKQQVATSPRPGKASTRQQLATSPRPGKEPRRTKSSYGSGLEGGRTVIMPSRERTGPLGPHTGTGTGTTSQFTHSEQGGAVSPDGNGKNKVASGDVSAVLADVFNNLRTQRTAHYEGQEYVQHRVDDHVNAHSHGHHKEGSTRQYGGMTDHHASAGSGMVVIHNEPGPISGPSPAQHPYPQTPQPSFQSQRQPQAPYQHLSQIEDGGENAQSRTPLSAGSSSPNQRHHQYRSNHMNQHTLSSTTGHAGADTRADTSPARSMGKNSSALESAAFSPPDTHDHRIQYPPHQQHQHQHWHSHSRHASPNPANPASLAPVDLCDATFSAPPARQYGHTLRPSSGSQLYSGQTNNSSRSPHTTSGSPATSRAPNKLAPSSEALAAFVCNQEELTDFLVDDMLKGLATDLNQIPAKNKDSAHAPTVGLGVLGGYTSRGQPGGRGQNLHALAQKLDSLEQEEVCIRQRWGFIQYEEVAQADDDGLGDYLFNTEDLAAIPVRVGTSGAFLGRHSQQEMHLSNEYDGYDLNDSMRSLDDDGSNEVQQHRHPPANVGVSPSFAGHSAQKHRYETLVHRQQRHGLIRVTNNDEESLHRPSNGGIFKRTDQTKPGAHAAARHGPAKHAAARTFSGNTEPLRLHVPLAQSQRVLSGRDQFKRYVDATSFCDPAQANPWCALLFDKFDCPVACCIVFI